MGTSKNQPEHKEALRALPSVDELLRVGALEGASALYARPLVVDAAREVLDEVREAILSGAGEAVDTGTLASLIIERLGRVTAPRLKAVVNATGCVIHTNMGRAPLATEAIDAVVRASGACNVELDVETGERGERDSLVEGLIKRLTGAEAACVVNNNAAAVLIVLNTLAEGRGVLISRGELIEIGGSFRLPEIIAKSGCVMVEVGTTNRTHPSDYTRAITPDTALIFKAHTSNYRIEGFTSEVPFAELVQIGRESGLPVALDLGSGSLVDLAEWGLPAEPIVAHLVRAGADVVTFSGDKLLGGPQAGIIVGRQEVIDRVRRNPLKRALRPDKLTYAALEATLALYLDPEKLGSKLPVLRTLARPAEEMERAAREAAALVADALGPDYEVNVEPGYSVVGGGSLPGVTLPTWVVTVKHGTFGPERIYTDFLTNTPPIVGRVHKGVFMLDMRTVELASDVVPKPSGPRTQVSN